VALEDNTRVVEKSRLPWKDSQRIGKERDSTEEVVVNHSDYHSDDDERDTKKAAERFDEECYDDRPFYSMLLKVRRLSIILLNDSQIKSIYPNVYPTMLSHTVHLSSLSF
jgi:hypothetical protein